MKPKQSSSKRSADKVIKDIRRKTRRHFSAEDKIRIVLEGQQNPVTPEGNMIRLEWFGNRAIVRFGCSIPKSEQSSNSPV